MQVLAPLVQVELLRLQEIFPLFSNMLASKSAGELAARLLASAMQADSPARSSVQAALSAGDIDLVQLYQANRSNKLKSILGPEISAALPELQGIHDMRGKLQSVLEGEVDQEQALSTFAELPAELKSNKRFVRGSFAEATALVLGDTAGDAEPTSELVGKMSKLLQALLAPLTSAADRAYVLNSVAHTVAADDSIEPEKVQAHFFKALKSHGVFSAGDFKAWATAEGALAESFAREQSLKNTAEFVASL